MKLLEGKYALITGGGRGIGKAVALEFAKNGANIAVVALEKDELDKTVKEIEKYNVRGISIPTDLTSIENLEDCVAKYFDNFERCDILVNNAGMSHYSTILEYPLESAVKLFNLNLISYYGMVKLLLPKMLEQGQGNIIMTSSIQGNMFFTPKKVAYSTSKAAVAAMGKCMQAELEPFNIRVNVILPGAIQTKLVQDNIDKGQKSPTPDPPEAISPMYLFLASNLSERRYKGRLINQYFIKELMSKLEKEINGKNSDINKLLKIMKPKLTKGLYEQLRINRELVDFMLKYEG